MKKVLLIVCIASTILALACIPAAASVMTMQAAGVSNGGAFPQTYGDNISGVGPDANGHLYAEGNGFTPNVVVDHVALHANPGTGTGYKYYSDGEWPQVAYLATDLVDEGDARIFEFKFTPDAGYGVRVNSFLLDPYGSTTHEIDWTVYKDSADPGNVLASGSTGSISSNTGVSTGLSAFHSGMVLLHVQQVTGAPGNIGVDDLNFDQVFIPEPTSLSALAIGVLSLLCGVRWRKGRL